jgi:histidyl-tRNA synthetase
MSTESRVLATLVPSLNDVIDILLNKISWKLPQDLAERAQDAIQVTVEQLKAMPMAECVEKFIPVHRVALVAAAANLQIAAPEVAKTLLEINDMLPEQAYEAKEDFSNGPFDLSAASITDEMFTEFLNKLYPEVPKEVKQLFEVQYVSSSCALIIAATMEKVADYALIAAVLEGEFKQFAQLPAEIFSRENAPQFVSIVAQRISDITLNSKNIKKKGSDQLAKVPRLFAPIFQNIAAVRTATAKSQHFYDKFLLFSYINIFPYATSEIINHFGYPEKDITTFNCVQKLAAAAFAKISEFAPKVQESIKAKRLTVGTIGRDISLSVLEKGPASFQELKFFFPPEGKKVIPKEATGTRDLMPKQMKIREQVIALITSIFKRHGAVSIDTPVFELRSVLTEKYGEESKLIYNLEDQGGELLSLRYDLTVPFARFVATHGITKIKRYHIAKVYRRDKPAMDRGRFREFYQCDFDFAGPSGTMIADAEVISIVCELLDAIGNLCKIKTFNYSIRVSHRKLLSAMTKVAGVPDEKFKTVCSSVDKLDKQEWEEVARELVDVKGLSQAAVDKLGEFVIVKGEPTKVLETLRAKEDFAAIAGDTLNEMEILFKYLDAIGYLPRINFDLSLARGLDYYTGVIYEAGEESGLVGSIAGGGRYDELIGMFTGKKVPAVGVSLGIERVFTLIEKMSEKDEVKEADTQIYIASIAADYTTERFQLASKFWEKGIPTEIFPKAKPDIRQQLQAAEVAGAKVVVILAPEEQERGEAKIREITPKGVTRDPIERVVKIEEIVDQSIKLLNDIEENKKKEETA